MFKRVLSGAIAAISVAVFTPAFAGEGSPFGAGLGGRFGGGLDDDSYSLQHDASMTIKVEENVSTGALEEGRQAPASHDATTEDATTMDQNGESTPFDRSMDAGG